MAPFRISPLVFSRSSRPRQAFTLVELLVAIAVFFLILIVIFQITKTTASLWQNSSGKITAFSEARGAFEAMTRTISQATLNAYVDYVDASHNFRATGDTTFTPVNYARRSDLQFISGASLLSSTSVPSPITHSIFFQAPLGYSRVSTDQGMQGLLNACGFFVYYGQDLAKPGFLPSSVPNRKRYRLMQFLQPSENLSIYDPTVTAGSTTWNNTKWFTTPIGTDVGSTSPTCLSQLAENVVALIILPKNSTRDDQVANQPLAPNYEYDSRKQSNLPTLYQLPPVVQVVMVVIDDASATKLGDLATPINFVAGANLSDSTQLSDALKTIEQNLIAAPGNSAGNTIPLRFQMFNTEVAVPAAKWGVTLN